MNKSLLLIICLLLTLSFAHAAKVVKVKGRTVLLKDSNASTFIKGSKLRLKDGNGKTKGIVKVSKIKGSIIITRLLKGKAKNGWQGIIIKRKSKKSNRPESDSTNSSTDLDYFSVGGGMYATSADNYDKSLLLNLEYAMGFPSLKNWIFSGTFLYSTEVLNEATLAGDSKKFTFKQTTMHFLGQIKYKLTEMFYANLAGGYYSSSATGTYIADSESFTLDMSGYVIGAGGGVMIEMNKKSFLDLNITMLSYTASSISFNGQENANPSAGDSRMTATAAYGIRF